MKKMTVSGGNPLFGECIISGSKNAALPIIAACVCINENVTLYNCPHITDVYTSVEIINSLGGTASLNNNVLTINCRNLSNNTIDKALCQKMRSSITFCGGLLAKTGSVTFCRPGGCVLGSRPINLHLNGFKALGAIAEETDTLCTVSGSLNGANIKLPFPSVGATQNIIIAACLAKGKTTLINPSLEPETLELISFLNKCGANVRVEYGKIEINGVPSLNGCTHKIMADRIEAGTYLFAAKITGGKIRLAGISMEELGIIANIASKTGAKLKGGTDFVEIDGTTPIRSIAAVKTAPHPGFPTDLQPQLTALLSLAKGKSTVKETVFESRNRHIPQLKKFGANIVETPDFVIHGTEKFVPAAVTAQDLRGGAALMLAALAAKGSSTIYNVDYILRGYEKPAEKINNLGGNIEIL